MHDPVKLNNLKLEHQNILAEKLEGARIRSKLKWWEDVEKSTNYFYGLEKRNGKNKAWDKILDEDDNIIYGTKAIQARQVRFYKKLFTTQNLDSNENIFFLNQPSKQLTKEQKEDLQTEITFDDISKALKLIRMV